MKGLVFKDLITELHELRRMAVFLLVFAFGMPILFSASSGDWSDVYGMPLTMCSVLGMVIINNAFAYDEKSGWMQYALVNPVSRMQYYHAKLLTHAINTITGSVLGLAVSSLLAAVTGQMTLSLFGQLLAQAGATAAALCLIGIWIIPLFLKYGVQKGTFMVMLIFIGVAILCTGLVMISFGSMANPFAEGAPLWTPILLVLIVLGSFVTLYLLGRKWMGEKEF
ncbi:MAG: ABC-2 transporter permease [Oscillospiraceae bacterium]|nr:ABC-2 transporter permease [Oscillospiraceae bacterium]